LDGNGLLFATEKGSLESADGAENLFHFLEDGGTACCAGYLSAFGSFACFGFEVYGLFTNVGKTSDTC
jgi:hypothetical protein